MAFYSEMLGRRCQPGVILIVYMRDNSKFDLITTVLKLNDVISLLEQQCNGFLFVHVWFS